MTTMNLPFNRFNGWMILFVIGSVLLTACAHRYHLARAPRDSTTIPELRLNVGQERLVVSEEPLSGLFLTLAPTWGMVRSSNPDIITVKAKSGSAWIAAENPGTALIIYHRKSGRPEMITRVRVLDRGE